MFISKKELNNLFWKIFCISIKLLKISKVILFAYHKFSIMRVFKSIIYLLNRDSYAKRIVLLFLIIELSKQNGFFLFGGRA